MDVHPVWYGAGGLALGIAGTLLAQKTMAPRPAGALGWQPQGKGPALPRNPVLQDHISALTPFSYGLITDDSSIQTFLRRAGYTWQTWPSLSLAWKRAELQTFHFQNRTLREGALNYTMNSTSGAYYSIDPLVAAVDAYCLRMAVNAQQAHNIAQQMPQGIPGRPALRAV